MAEFSAGDVSLLAGERVRELLANALKRNLDSLKFAAQLSREFPVEARRVILDYYELLPKVWKKFDTREFLLCDRLAFEQATASDLGKFKAALWPERGSVLDLCAGMGGDSLFLPSALDVCGVDLDAARLAMYRENLKVFGRQGKTLLADARDENLQADYFTIDPARRKILGENQRDVSQMSPNLSEVLEISKRYKGGMAKLPPAFPPDEIPLELEVLYLGSGSDCRETLLLFGELSKFPGRVRAVAVGRTGVAEHEWVSGFERGAVREGLKVEAPKRFLAEPCPLLVRSHLFEELALAHSATLISSGIAYLTSEEPIVEAGFRNFKILDVCVLGTAAVRQMLKAHKVGKLTLKKRGVEVVPEREIARLAPRGTETATLFYTRIDGEKSAILAREVG